MYKSITTLFLLFCLSHVLFSQQATLDSIISKYENHLESQKEALQTEWPERANIELHDQYRTYVKWLDELQQVDQGSISEQSLINYDLLELILTDRIENLNYRSELFPLSAEGGFILSMVYAIKRTRIEDDSDFFKYLLKLEETPRHIEEQIALMKIGLIENKVMPVLIVKNCLKLLNKHRSEGLEIFRLPYVDRNFDISDVEKADRLIRTELVPVFDQLADFLENDYLTSTTEAVGIGHCMDGKSFYEQRVRYYTTLDMTPQEVYDTGLSEVKRIKSEMEQIISDLQFKGSFSDFLHFLRTDMQFYAKTEQELLDRAAWLSMKAQEILPKYFNTLPRLPFTVNPVPADIAPTYTTGRYSGGSFKNHKAGEYWVNTYNLPARPLYVLPALTLHEAVPGHHLQISLANELEGLPKFRRTQYLSAFGEGWGLYAEYLGKEAGIYITPYEEFGRLTYEMWRACRLVIDPGIHYFGWTRQEAIDYMSENTSLSMHEINTEIDRYIGWPGQAVSYKIGELKIRELRSRAEEKLGEDFDIRAFHDLLLSNGSVPLTTLERIVMGYVQEDKN